MHSTSLTHILDIRELSKTKERIAKLLFRGYTEWLYFLTLCEFLNHKLYIFLRNVPMISRSYNNHLYFMLFISHLFSRFMSVFESPFLVLLKHEYSVEEINKKVKIKYFKIRYTLFKKSLFTHYFVVLPILI